MVKGVVMVSSLIVVFLLILHYNAGFVHCFGEKNPLDLQQCKMRDHIASSCLSKKPNRKKKGATILEMKHRNYSNGFGGRTKDWNKLLRSRLILDEQRVGSLQARIKNKGSNKMFEFDVSAAQIPITSGKDLGVLDYIVTVELGGQNMTVIVDTGSDLTWIQCEPCLSCYEQNQPIFNPSTSPSYHTVSCNSSECQSLLNATAFEGTCGDNPPATCNYLISYADGSYSRGVLGHDHLNIGYETSVNDFVFGCARNSKGIFRGSAGLLGLGRASNISLVSQASAIFGGVFSYCLPPPRSGASGSLVLGGNSSVYNTSTPFSYTRILPNPYFYYLNLTGITVNGVALQDSAFGRKAMIIDSGTLITRLPPTIYKALKAEFLKLFSGYPSAPAVHMMDTCFNLSTSQNFDIPNIKMQFEGNAEMNLDQHGVLYFLKPDMSQICLAFASLSSEGKTGILANYQQINQRVIYDIKESKLGFAREDCSFT